MRVAKQRPDHLGELQARQNNNITSATATGTIAKPDGTPTTSSIISGQGGTAAASSAPSSPDTGGLASPSSISATSAFSTSVTSKMPAKTSTEPSDSSSGSVTAGVAAGVGIGCAFVGALLAALIILCVKRRKSPQSSRKKYPAKAAKGPSAKHEKFSGVSDNLDDILPQPLADDKIAQDVNGLFTMVDGHAVNYYHEEVLSEPFMPSKELLPTALVRQQQFDLVALLAKPRTRSSAIAAIVCAKVLESISVTGVPRTSLLPPVITWFLRSISPPSEDSHAYQLSLSRWRVSTIFLRGNPSSRDELEHRQNAIQAIIADLDQLLGPYIISEGAGRRLKDLELLCERAAKVGLVLVSQPARWDFYWSVPERMRGPEERGSARSTKPRLVIFPGLWRLTDNAAKTLRSPCPFLDPRVLH